MLYIYFLRRVDIFYYSYGKSELHHEIYSLLFLCSSNIEKKKEKEKNANWFHQFSSTLMQELEKKYSNKMFIVMLNQKGFLFVEMDTIKAVLNRKDFEPRF